MDSFSPNELAAIDRHAERNVAHAEFVHHHPEYQSGAHQAFDQALRIIGNSHLIAAAASAPALEPLTAAPHAVDAADCEAMDDMADFAAGLTPQQRKGRAEFEAAMRAGELRGIPSVFGALEHRSECEA